MKKTTIVIIAIASLLGICISILTEILQIRQWLKIVMINIGCGLIATAIISVILDLFWSKERAKIEKEEMQPFLDKFNEFTQKLGDLEGRLEAFKLLGLNYCYSSRNIALEKFFKYASEAIGRVPQNKESDIECVKCTGKINIVSSSARGLIGYLDREDNDIQKKWRELITKHPKNFQILLTHPAYAHLRQPAEERSSGDIEMEILKTAMYLLMVAGMSGNGQRFYRGSPTVFLIQVNKYYLVNIYPYGKMAMDTLCLEFESVNENTYVADFARMHFHHTWNFLQQNSKTVDGKPLVEGISDFVHILTAFSECTTLSDSTNLRLTKNQVQELDTFFQKIKEITNPQKLQDWNLTDENNPFMKFVIQKKYVCCNESVSENDIK